MMDKNLVNSEETLDPVFENMFKKFLRQVKKDGVIEEVKARRYYIKESEKNRLEKKSRSRHVR